MPLQEIRNFVLKHLDDEWGLNAIFTQILEQ
jgi:hypothetical protein